MNVYFIVATFKNKRLLKIGKARDIPRRLAQLQVGCPYRLSLLAYISCMSDKQAFAVEKAAHEMFQKRRIRADGEWFRLPKVVEDEVIRFAEIARTRFESVAGYSEPIR